MGETLKNTPGVGDEAVKSVFKYEHSDYDGPRLAAKADREAARQRLAGKKPFVGHVSRALHRKELPMCVPRLMLCAARVLCVSCLCLQSGRCVPCR